MQNDKKYPENHAANDPFDPEMMKGVYGGPEFLNPQLFMTVYAGPEMMQSGGRYEPLGAPAPADDGPRKKWCVNCGMTIDETAKFCTECGAPQPKADA